MRDEVVILMYHAIDGDPPAPAGADPHYTVAAGEFAAQLDALAAAGVAVGCARDGIRGGSGRGVWLTFDDGDCSNHRVAFPMLAARGLRADFFVNPARVGLPGYATWGELREMTAAGMSIQSHGWDHVYFTSLAEPALREDLERSRKTIEDRVGEPVELLAPPGGRCPPRLDRIAADCGYRAVLGSAPGTLRAARREGVLPRVAVRAAHDARQVRDWALRGSAAMRGLVLRHCAYGAAKRLLGDRRYERLRSALLGGSG